MIKLIGKIKGILLQDQTDRTKELVVEIDPSATTGTRTTLSSAQTDNRSVVLPDANDTLVGRNTSDTLTNKIIDGDDNTIQDVDLPSLKTQLADAGKFLLRDGSGGVASGNAVPGGTVVGDTDTQTLTNKTIDADSNAITNIEDADIKSGAAIDTTKLANGTVSNIEFQYLDGVASSIQTQINTKQATSEKAQPNGYASLDGSGLVPSSQLPSYVDDVLEYANFAALPVTGETGKIYITLDDDKQFRWSGSVYIQISNSISQLDDLTDVDLTTVAPASNDILIYNGSEFAPAALPAAPNLSVVTIDALGGTYTPSASDDVILVDGSSGPVGIDLPAPSGITGKVYTVKKVTSDFAPGIIGTVGAETIDGLGSVRVTFEHDVISVVSDGTNWKIKDYYQEEAYFEADVTASNPTTTADVYVDSGASLTLPAGTYDIGYSGSLYINRTGAAGGVVGTGAIRDSANNVISNTTLQVGVILSGSFAMFPATASTQITLATQTTIKLSARCGTGSANFDVYWVPENFTGALTNPDGGSRIFARRLRK